MDSILEFGINLIRAFQGLGEWLVEPMAAFSFLGSEQFFLFVLPIVYWCINASFGFHLGLILMTTASLNTVFKLVLHGPRPPWISTQIRAFAAEGGFGIPSGHSQNAVGVWGILALWSKRKWAWVVAILIILMIGLSRIYLGVHFPSDVLTGWLVGTLILWAYAALRGWVSSWIEPKKASYQVTVALLFSLILILLGVLARNFAGVWEMPMEWSVNAANAQPVPSDIHPWSLSGIFTTAGVLFGLSVGVILLKRGGGFDAGGEAWKRVVRFGVGLVGVLIFYIGLDMIFPEGDDLVALVFRYLRYALVGLWVAGLAPLVFIALKLAQPSRKPTQ